MGEQETLSRRLERSGKHATPAQVRVLEYRILELEGRVPGMPGDAHRLDELARATLLVLDEERARTHVDEWDESDPRCYLYNAATAVIERAIHGDKNIDECIAIALPDDA